MDNYALAEQFSLLAKLMEIHGENSFKAKSYSTAAFTIEKWPVELETLQPQQIFAIRGIGESVGLKIIDLLQGGELAPLKEILERTPSGVLDMMQVKGLGPKKLNTLWKELGIDSIEGLAAACTNNTVAQQKGFGAKTQEKILESISFILDSKGKLLWAQAEVFVLAINQKIKDAFPNSQVEITGAFRRQLEVIDKLEWVVDTAPEQLRTFLQGINLSIHSENDNILTAQTDSGFILQFHFAGADNFGTILFVTSSSPEFVQAWQQDATLSNAPSEAALFEQAGKSFLPAYLREHPEKAKGFSYKPEELLQPGQIKGLIHAHSNWSDGANTLEEMAHELMRRGFEYLVISDHSKAAFYANGLSEERIRKQHQLIDQLNKQLAPFKIYKSIECDILNDGSLDYSKEVLASFDLVIASIHSNLDMDEAKAMERLMGAINNPHVHIMGHLSGRRLLRRPGYPVNYTAIIDACAANGVAIEINASPERLDLDWRWIETALQKGVLLSVNPDAHSIEGIDNIRYGVLAAQKGGLKAAKNISSFSRQEFEAWLNK